jgi:hypothetical protein
VLEKKPSVKSSLPSVVFVTLGKEQSVKNKTLDKELLHRVFSFTEGFFAWSFFAECPKKHSAKNMKLDKEPNSGSVRMALTSNKGVKATSSLIPPKNRLSNFVMGKTSIVQNREGYILYPENYPKHKIKKIHARKSHTIFHHAYMYSNEVSSSKHANYIKIPKKKIVDAFVGMDFGLIKIYVMRAK